MPNDSEAPRELGLDEIVALNLADLVEKRKISIAHLARSLGVSRAHIYDMLGRRPGRPQREFRWKEIVRLAGILEVLVLDLVLPPDGVMLDGGMYLTRFQATEIWEQPRERVEHLHAGALSRNEVAIALFGLPGDYLNEDNLESMRRFFQASKAKGSKAMAERSKEFDSLIQGVIDAQEILRKMLEERGL